MTVTLRLQVTLPDLYSACPYDRAIHPDADKIGSQAIRWIERYGLFGNSKRASAIYSHAIMLTAYFFAYVPRDKFRLCCDLIIFLFVFDELTDDEESGDAVRVFSSLVLETLQSRRPSESSDHVLVRITADFRDEMLQRSSRTCYERFVILMERYLDAVATETDRRVRNVFWTNLDSFTLLRREGSAVKVGYGLLEFCLGEDLPDEIWCDGTFQQAYIAAVDLYCIGNDIYSYNKEQSKGQGANNIIEIMMSTSGVTLQEAYDKAGDMWVACVKTYMHSSADVLATHEKSVPSLRDFFQAMTAFIRGNLDYSFECGRFFGSGGRAVKETRRIEMLPKRKTITG